MTELDPVLAWLFELRGPSLKWDLETALALDAWLGSPHRRFAVAHVAGTNGKGSVSAMLDAILGAAGQRAGLFTSPHLVCPTERIRIAGEPIGLERFRDQVLAMRGNAERALAAGALPRHPSFFEMMTAIAFATFAHDAVDAAVIEVGLGGRLDATNVVTPQITAITSIALDHVKSLGGSLASIAREKAGIVKPGVPLVLGAMDDEPKRAIRAIARERGVPVHDATVEVAIEYLEAGVIALHTPVASYPPVRLALAGRHQSINAAVAVRVAELWRERAGLALPESAFVQGLERTVWPGRLERVGTRPTFLLDAAHNVQGAESLGAYLRETDARLGRPPRRVLVFGITEGREADTLVGPLASSIDSIIVTEPSIPRAVPAADVHAALRGAALPLELEPDPGAAMARAREAAGEQGEVIVAGSLYLVGDVRKRLLGLDGAGHPRREIVPDVRPAP